jgi:hypothetical protein
MMWLIAAFLIAHGAVHLAVWLAPAQTESEHPAPFAPDHSAVLTRTHVAQSTTHLTAVRLAGAATVAYVLAGLAVAVGSAWAVALAAVAAVTGLALKVLFFNPWLSLGVVIDAAVLSSAWWSWPLTLT